MRPPGGDREGAVCGKWALLAEKASIRMLMAVTVLALLLLLAPDPVDEQLSILRRLSKLPYEQGKRLTAIGKLGRIGSENSTRAL